MKKITALDIANYFLILLDRDEGDSITHLKLQKLIYFAQGISISLTDKLLFDEPMIALQHGPVSSSVYNIFKVFGNNTIPQPPEMDFDIYDHSVKNLIYKVYNIYGEHTASHLRNLSHEHSSWVKAFNTQERTINYKEVKNDFIKNNHSIENLDVSGIDKQSIIDAEDRWWMSYDCGVPSENITERLVRNMELMKQDKQAFIDSCVTIEGF